MTFTAGAPSAETDLAGSIGPTTATIEGEIDPASQTTNYWADYGLASSTWCKTGGSSGNPEYSTTSEGLGFEDEEFHKVAVGLSGLHPDTEYCAELVAKNGSGSGHGGQLIFTTSRVPLARTVKASATGTSTATVEGEINAEGQTAHYKVDYALASSKWCTSGGSLGVPSESGQTLLQHSDSAWHPVAVELSGLTPGSEYCADLVAIGESSALAGQQVPFTTTALPSLSVSLSGTGSGTVHGGGISCPGTCSQSYASGTKVELTAAPAAGSTFAGWSGACAGTGTCITILSENRQVTATFTANASSTGSSSAGSGGVLGATAASSSVLLVGSTVTVQSSGEAAVKLDCAGTTACSGKLTLTVKITTKKGKTKHTKTESIATTTLSIPADETVSIKLKLGHSGRALLSASHGSLKATLTILKTSPSPSNTQTKSVRLALQKAKKG